ncbi:hypothetical protein FE257_002474 [Aspergillus nanangensis]|uniref:P-loop containing nucleoside triphosphate hydrolase protein n=1 Tax=Aspergillus nanangensis TaxID=2582783 RepID=A0AAD4CUL8_ASPNN|nr:hypothetical protein FE257_002474 [Aspergillus nanangensis]
MSTLEEWLYPVPPPPPRPRTKPMRVLALGISRSGTESLARALRILGYDHVFHGFEIWERTPMLWKTCALLGRRKYCSLGTIPGHSGVTREDFDLLYGDCEAITDQPAPQFARELIAAYPEAKVILNTREMDAWHRSLCTVLRPLTTGVVYHVLPWFNADLYWERQFVRDCLGPFFHGSWERHGKWVYEAHSAMVRGSVAKERLLEWTPEEGWGPLCRFLDKDIPDEEFPSGNLPANVQNEFDNNMTRCIGAAMRNFAITVVGLGGLAAYALARNRVDWGWIKEVDLRAMCG